MSEWMDWQTSWARVVDLVTWLYNYNFLGAVIVWHNREPSVQSQIPMSKIQHSATHPRGFDMILEYLLGMWLFLRYHISVQCALLSLESDTGSSHNYIVWVIGWGNSVWERGYYVDHPPVWSEQSKTGEIQNINHLPLLLIILILFFLGRYHQSPR